MQTRRMTHEEIDHTLCLFAAMNTLHKILGIDRMESRIRFIPNGWRDANMIYDGRDEIQGLHPPGCDPAKGPLYDP